MQEDATRIVGCETLTVFEFYRSLDAIALILFLFFLLCNNCYTHEIVLIRNFFCTLFPCTRWFQRGYVCGRLGVWSTWIYCFAFIQA